MKRRHFSVNCLRGIVTLRNTPHHKCRLNATYQSDTQINPTGNFFFRFSFAFVSPSEPVTVWTRIVERFLLQVSKTTIKQYMNIIQFQSPKNHPHKNHKIFTTIQVSVYCVKGKRTLSYQSTSLT